MADLDNPIMEPSELFYGKEEVTPDLNETTEDQPLIEPEEAAEAQSVKTEDSVESEQHEDETEDNVDYSLQVVDIGDEEVTVEQIKKWKSEGMMQADYTRKRQADADAKREWEADKQKQIDAVVSEKHKGLDESVAMLQELIKEQDDSIDWDDLREFDQGEYLKQKELKEKREAGVKQALDSKAEAPKLEQSPEFIAEQQKLMIAQNPSWIDKEGNVTEYHAKDMKMLSEYMDKAGYTAEENAQISTAKHWKTLLDAAKYQESLKKVEKVEAKIKKLPVTTKPKKGSVKSTTSVENLFYGNN
jgi:hypothetical protein